MQRGGLDGLLRGLEPGPESLVVNPCRSGMCAAPRGLGPYESGEGKAEPRRRVAVDRHRETGEEPGAPPGTEDPRASDLFRLPGHPIEVGCRSESADTVGDRNPEIQGGAFPLLVGPPQ